MYRHLLFLVLIGYSEQFANSGRCDNQRETWPWVARQSARARASMDRSVAKIASDIVLADRNIRDFCRSHADHYMKETYGMDNYKLSLTVDDFDEYSISVKVMHKMVYVNAEDCSSTYADLRVLPDVVDPTTGRWKYALGELTIYFSYLKIAKDVTVEKNCGRFISTNVIVVPQVEEDTEFEDDIDVRFGDDEFKNNLRDFISTKKNKNNI